MIEQDVAKALLDIQAVRFVPHNPITFKSGIVSPVYVDNRRLPFHPPQWAAVIAAFQDKIESLGTALDVLAGVAVGGVPHSSALAFATQSPSVFVRKEAKQHGTSQLVEGGYVSGRNVILIEDLVTTGSSSLAGVAALRDAGAQVAHVLAIVSYGFEEAAQNFSSADVSLHTLTTFTHIINEGRREGLFDAEEETLIRDWFDEPRGWADRHS